MLALGACAACSDPPESEPVGTIEAPDTTSEAPADSAEAGLGEATSPEDALLNAASSYAEAETGQVFIATLEAQEGDYALVSVEPLDGDMDPALVYLKLENGAWTPLVLGTFFSPEDYEALGIPAALQEESMP